MGLLFNIAKSIYETVKSQNESQNVSQKTTQASSSYQNPKTERTEEEWIAYFREILTTEFTQYTVQECVPVQNLAGYVSEEFKLYEGRPTQAYKAEWGKPYDFVLSQNGQPKGLLMLGKGHHHDNKVKYLISRMYAQKMGLPYIKFYTQFSNERDYVIQRINRFLNN